MTVDILGTNDAAVIGGTTSVNLTETNAPLSTSGQLTITDVDSAATFVAQTDVAGTNGYGKFTITANGAWTYVANSAHNEFVAGQHYSDSVTVTSEDGTTTTVTVDILGTNDAAVIGGTMTGSVTEAGATGPGTPTATGDLNSTDVDNTADAWTVVGLPTASAGGYGTYTIDATGHWTYTVDNDNATVNALNNGQQLTDSFTVKTVDGTSQVVTVTINGANDAVPDQAPDAVGDRIVTNIDDDWGALDAETISVPLWALLANDRDADGQTLSVTSASPVSGLLSTTINTGAGILNIVDATGGGSFTYTASTTAPVGSDTATVDVIRQSGSSLTGTDAKEILVGSGDSDTIDGKGGADIIFGNGGNDTIYADSSDRYVDGGTGTDTIYVAGDDVSMDLSGVEIVNVENLVTEDKPGNGGGFDQTITISAAQWANFSAIDMNDGNDVLNVKLVGDVDISGASITAVSDVETGNLIGSGGNDSITLTGSQLNAILQGSGSIDLGAGTDTINLKSTSTDLNSLGNNGLQGVEIISAASAAAGVTINLANQSEAFTLTGSSSGDTLTGGAGADTISGGNGDDTIVGAQNDILLDGGIGTDTLQIGANFTSTSNEQIVGIENITLTATATVNLANQTEGFKILGSSGGDTIVGGAGADIINGLGGNDTLTGGAGNDQFRLQTNSGTDVITDFTVGQDKIGLVDIFNNTTGTSAGAALNANDFISRSSIGNISNSDDNKVIVITTAQSSSQISATEIAGSGSPTNNYVLVFNSTTGKGELWFDSDWSDAANRVHVATLSNITSLAQLGNISASDIVVYNNATDPIILDLDHNGVALTTLDQGVQFDINADGHKDQIAWTAGSDGILAYDVDGNGKIDNGSEIFSPHFAGGSYVDGLAALSTLDSNRDGKIDAADEAFSKLTVWQDLNHNGITDSGELSSLADHSISSISLDANASNSEINGQSILADGSYTLTDGSTGHFVEVAFDTTLGGSENGSNAYSLIGSDGDDILSGSGGMYTLTGGAGADTFVLDADALNDVKLADVITDYKASEGDALDVSKLLDSLLGHQATEAEALTSVKTTVSGADTVVSVNANGGWHDVAVLQNTTEAVKILFDDKHDTTTAPHVG
ncbi:VCBS domain-containing protein [Rhizobium grahamii]|uniref:beta strand repeat-containing protein n=1 Tax=Rhizobium grahamii TaxID=1120045 RepID=UPI0016773D49